MVNPEPQVREISLNELVEKRRHGEPFILVDVLTHEHFAHIHIPGSINVTQPELRVPAPLLFGKDDRIIVYCSNQPVAHVLHPPLPEQQNEQAT